MLRIIFALLLLAGCQATAPSHATSADCTLPPATILESTGDPHTSNSRLLQVWDIPDNPALWSTATPTDAGYADFLAKLHARGIDTDPVAILKASPTHNNDLVAAHAAEWIHPAGCLEKLLVGLQHSRIDTFVAPTEFASVVLRSPDAKRLRIYYLTINQDGIGRASPLTNPADADHAAGWQVLIALHVHAFHPGQPLLNGIVSPSVPDAGFNKNFAEGAGLQQAWITNGIDTVRIPASAFGEFEAE